MHDTDEIWAFFSSERPIAFSEWSLNAKVTQAIFIILEIKLSKKTKQIINAHEQKQKTTENWTWGQV